MDEQITGQRHTESGEQRSSTAGTKNLTAIDLQQLADRVYELMMAEARLARARDGR